MKVEIDEQTQKLFQKLFRYIHESEYAGFCEHLDDGRDPMGHVYGIAVALKYALQIKDEGDNL